MDITGSVQTILGRKEIVIRRFYDLFLNRHPEAQPYFEGVNLEHQATLLTMALIMIESHYSHEYPATEHYLKVLGHRHHHDAIPPELFPKFRDCLIETLSEVHGEEWDDVLAGHWRAAIDKATSTMLEGYKRPYTF